jgi:protein import protein ZIM17
MRPSPSLLRAFARASAPRPLKASPAEHIPAPAKRLLHTLRTSPATRPSPVLSRVRALPTRRFESTSAAPTQPSTSTKAPESRLDREQVPSYELTFTCNVCKTRSSHRMSKQGYHHGTILISCPDCKNRHLISDHLKVGCAFGMDRSKTLTLADILRQVRHNRRPDARKGRSRQERLAEYGRRCRVLG